MNDKTIIENRIRKMRIGFMILGGLTTFLSIVGLLSFIILDFKYINPLIYGLGIIIGFGWLISAYVT